MLLCDAGGQGHWKTMTKQLNMWQCLVQRMIVTSRHNLILGHLELIPNFTVHRFGGGLERGAYHWSRKLKWNAFRQEKLLSSIRRQAWSSMENNSGGWWWQGLDNHTIIYQPDSRGAVRDLWSTLMRHERCILDPGDRILQDPSLSDATVKGKP